MKAPGSSGSSSCLAVDNERPKVESAVFAPSAAADPMASQPSVWRDGRLRTSRTVSPNRSAQTPGDRPLIVVRAGNDAAGRLVAAMPDASETVDGGALSGAVTCDPDARVSCARAHGLESSEQATRVDITYGDR